MIVGIVAVAVAVVVVGVEVMVVVFTHFDVFSVSFTCLHLFVT